MIRVGKLVLAVTEQAGGAPLVDSCVTIERTVTFTGEPGEVIRRAGGWCIANPLALRRQRWRSDRAWRTRRICRALVVGWVGWDGPLPKRPMGRAVLEAGAGMENAGNG